MTNILELINVSKTYQDFSLRNINLSLKPGYIMGFIGPNGAGKSTTIKLIMGLIKKDAGEIKIFGMDQSRHGLAIKERIGFVYDENFYYEELTIEEMKNMVRAFYSKWDEALFQRYLKEFELPKNRRIKELSKGMKMKFSLAVALSHDADLLIMDEPTSGLDPLVRRELLEILQTFIQNEQKSVFFSTHITSDLEKIADYITIINHGQILLSTTKDELLDEYCLVKGSKELLNEINRKHLVAVKEHRFGFEALARNRRDFNRLYGGSVLIEKPSLEDIMFYTVHGGETHGSAESVSVN